MQRKISPWSIGASLYVPATHLDLVNILTKNKFKNLKSIIICLEDAVKENDLTFAIKNLQAALESIAHVLKHDTKNTILPLIFIRPRHLQMAQWIRDNINIDHIIGLVIPKFSSNELDAWWHVIQDTSLMLMPTLEDAAVYDVNAMTHLAQTLSDHPCKNRIIVLRIGGNDLMNGLRLRRDRTMTLYDGPLGYIIKMLVTIFASKGFYLTAPVCEHFDNIALLEQELKLDLMHGLVGKTIIHPKQISILENIYQVSKEEIDEALQIINATEAVFKQNGSMCEPTTHSQWAQEIVERSTYFGIAK